MKILLVILLAMSLLLFLRWGRNTSWGRFTRLWGYKARKCKRCNQLHHRRAKPFGQGNTYYYWAVDPPVNDPTCGCLKYCDHVRGVR